MIAFLGEHGTELALGLTVVLAAGSLAVWLSRAPLHRHRLAELTLLAAVGATVLLSVPLPRPAGGWMATTPHAPGPKVSPSAVEVGTWETVSLVTELAPRAVELPAPADLPTVAAPVESETVESASVNSVRLAPPTPISHTVAALFLVGAALLTAHLLLALLLLRRTMRRAAAAPAWIASLAAEVAEAAGASAPRVLVSPRDVRPFCCGLGRGTVVLPASLAQPALATRVEAVLRHEHAHLAQRHPRGRLLAALAAPLLYWHPLYWWLAREQRNSAELLADDMAVGDFDKRRYVEELLELAESTRRAFVPQVSRLGVLGSRPDFLERMETLLMRRNRLATRSSAQHVTTRSLAACLLLAGVSVSWGMPPQDTEPENPSAVDNPLTVGYEIDESRRFGRLALETTARPARHDEHLRASFDIQGPAALGQLMLRCADNAFDVGAFDVHTPEVQGHRSCTLELSGASLEVLADIAASIEGVGLVAVESWSPGAAQGGASAGAPPAGGGFGAAPATNVGLQIARLAQQVDRLTQQYADMQTTNNHILNTLDASKPRKHSLEELERAVDAFDMPPAVTGQVLAVHESCEHVHQFGRGSNSRLVSINRGQDHGLIRGQQIEIYSGNTYKGRAILVEVSADLSFGTIVLEAEGQHIEAGDSATTDL